MDINQFYTDVQYLLCELLPKEQLSVVAEEMRQSLVQKLKGLKLPEPTPQPEEEALYEATDTDWYEQLPATATTPNNNNNNKVPTSPNNNNKGPTNPMTPLPPPTSSESDAGSDVLPAMAITAAALRATSAKHGPLYRKDKFIFVEQFRRCWAAVGSHYLFLFSSDKDSRPVVAHLLHGYEARPGPHFAKDVKKRDLCFELVSPGKKTHQLIARTQKDMHQWVVAINKEANKTNGSVPDMPVTNKPPAKPTEGKKLRRLPSIPCSDTEEPPTEEIYDLAVEEESADEDEVYEQMHSDDEIYYNIADVLPAESPAPPAVSSPPAQLPNSLDEGEEQYDDIHYKEDEYDDIVANQEDRKSYYNMNSSSVPPPPAVVSMNSAPNASSYTVPMAQPQQQDQEEFYDDVVVLRNKHTDQNSKTASALWRENDQIKPASQSSKTPTLPVPANRPPTLPVPANRPPVIPVPANRPPVIPVPANRPPVLPVPANRPPILPSQVNKPPTVPSQSNKPVQVNKRPTIPLQVSRPPTIPPQSAKPIKPALTSPNQTSKPTPPSHNSKPMTPVAKSNLPSSPAKTITSPTKVTPPTMIPESSVKPGLSLESIRTHQLKPRNSSLHRNNSSVTSTLERANSGNIKNMIKKMEATLVNKEKTPISNQSPLTSQNSGPSFGEEEDFYEPVDDDDTPKLPPRPNNFTA